METVIVTRHAALVEYLREIGLADANTIVIPHGGADDVRGRHVIGPLPMHLAVLAARHTVIPLDIPAELRGVELSLEQVRAMAGEPRAYVVREADQFAMQVADAFRAADRHACTLCAVHVTRAINGLLNRQSSVWLLRLTRCLESAKASRPRDCVVREYFRASRD